MEGDDDLNKNKLSIREKMKQLKMNTKNIDIKINDDDEEIFLGDYDVKDLVGQGASAKVKLLIDKSDNSEYAVKIYDKVKLIDPLKMRNLKNEIKLMKELDHENIIKFYNEIESKRHFYIIMEYIGKNSLYDILENGVISEKSIIIRSEVYNKADMPCYEVSS